MQEHQWPKAACILTIRDGAVLAVARKGESERFGLPGGKVEVGEPPDVAAARELREETGLSVDDPASLIEIYRDLEPSSSRTVVTYWTKDPGGDPRSEDGSTTLWVGWPTLLCSNAPFAEYNANVRAAYIDKIPSAWALVYGSGSLRRAIEEDMRWREMYLSERTALAYGYGFQAVRASRITLGDPLAEDDSRPTTETCWWARRLRHLGHRVRVVHARVCDDDVEEGIALVIEPNVRPHWLPRDRVLVAFTSPDGVTTVNPC